MNDLRLGETLFYHAGSALKSGTVQAWDKTFVWLKTLANTTIKRRRGKCWREGETVRK